MSHWRSKAVANAARYAPASASAGALFIMCRSYAAVYSDWAARAAVFGPVHVLWWMSVVSNVRLLLQGFEEAPGGTAVSVFLKCILGVLVVTAELAATAALAATALLVGATAAEEATAVEEDMAEVTAGEVMAGEATGVVGAMEEAATEGVATEGVAMATAVATNSVPS